MSLSSFSHVGPGLVVTHERPLQRLADLRLPPRFGVPNPFGFMQLQNVQELSKLLRTDSAAYQVGINGSVAFDEEF